MSTNDKKMPLGRPTLSVWLDVRSRMLVGYAVSLEPPSAQSALGPAANVGRADRARRYPYRQVIEPAIKQNARFPNSQTRKPLGRPKTILTDGARSFQSASLQQVLTEPDSGPARALDKQF